MGMRIASLLATSLCAVAATLAAQDSPKPAAGSTLPPPFAAERERRAAVVLAPYRYGDILWENDRTAHRIYGRPLEAAEPPSGSGIDAWGKNVRWPYMDRQLRSGHQHDDQGEGLDFYNVKTFRGAGGLGIWHDNKLWTSRNYARYRIIENGPRTARFEVEYDPWPVDIGRKVWETRRFTLPAGTSFTRMVSTIGSDRPDPLIVAIGIGKRTTSETMLGSFSADRKSGRISWWGPTDPVKGTMAVALMVDPAAIADIAQDADNYLVLLRVMPGKPFVYYMGAAWDGGPDFHTRPEWETYLTQQTPDFDPHH